jgi:hypothetical protein
MGFVSYPYLILLISGQTFEITEALLISGQTFEITEAQENFWELSRSFSMQVLCEFYYH